MHRDGSRTEDEGHHKANINCVKSSSSANQGNSIDQVCSFFGWTLNAKSKNECNYEATNSYKRLMVK